jgi:flavin-binding protein dodecin
MAPPHRPAQVALQVGTASLFEYAGPTEFQHSLKHSSAFTSAFSTQHSALRRFTMAIHKVIEVISQSDKGWEEAAQSAVRDAGKSVKNIRGIWIKSAEGVVEKNRITVYRIKAHITFELE